MRAPPCRRSSCCACTWRRRTRASRPRSTRRSASCWPRSSAAAWPRAAGPQRRRPAGACSTAQQIAENPLLGGGRTHPTFVELGTNRARFVHRYGSNIWNGACCVDDDHRDTPSHCSAGCNVNIAALQKTYDELAGMSDAAVAEMAARSPLKVTQAGELPKYFSLREVDFADLMTGAVMTSPAVSDADARAVIDDLGTRNHWLTPLSQVTNACRGNGPGAEYAGGAYRSKHVGDICDTSPYDPQDPPLIAPCARKDRPLGISTSNFVSNLGKLIAYVAPVK